MKHVARVQIFHFHVLFPSLFVLLALRVACIYVSSQLCNEKLVLLDNWDR